MALTTTERQLKYCIAWLVAIAERGCEYVERERGPLGGPFRVCRERDMARKDYCRSCEAALALKLMQDEEHTALMEENRWS